jgi:hypothetical protein
VLHVETTSSQSLSEVVVANANDKYPILTPRTVRGLIPTHAAEQPPRLKGYIAVLSPRPPCCARHSCYESPRWDVYYMLKVHNSTTSTHALSPRTTNRS